jgi:hypothetical protein
MTLLIFGPGDTVPHSGIYAVLHGKPHTQYASLFVDSGTFPRCNVCGAQVTFRLIQAVGNISQEPDFSSGAGTVAKSA